MSLAGTGQPARRRLIRSALFGALLLLGGCGTLRPGGGVVVQAPASVPRAASVPGVPFFAQEERYCGPASLAMVLAWSGLDVDQDAVAPEVYTPGRKGTMAADMLAAARRRGRLAVPVGSLDALYREIAAGNPVLVFQNLGISWYSVWHFAVVTGYSLETGQVTLHSGTDPDHVMSLGRFERSWAAADHWGLVVLPPGRLPASAGEPAIIEAAIGLERANQPAAAQAAYRAALAKWPDSFGAAIGLGNASYALGDFAGAEAAFRRATALRPDSAPAWNNLAMVFAEDGRIDPALYTARRAVETGQGGAPYRATLREVEARAEQRPDTARKRH